MTLFWIGAALLVALAWGALWPAWPAWPAWQAWQTRRAARRDGRPGGTRPAATGGRGAYLAVLGEQLAALDAELAAGRIDTAQHALSRSEVQRRMLDESRNDDRPPDAGGSRKTLAFIGAAVPLFAFALYMLLGNPAAMTAQVGSGGGGSAGAEVTPEAMNAMLTSLEQRLDKPSANLASDLQGWTLLARSYASLQRFPDASRAYARAIALAPTNAQLLTDHADVLAMLQGQSLQGEPDRLIAKALQIEPRNLKALALAGSSAFERKDFAAARGYWQQARALAPADSEFAAGLDRSLSEVASLSPPGPVAQAQAQAASAPLAAPTDGARISGRVSLAPALAARVAPTDTVFIFARAANGPRMPLAILKRTVAELPIAFTLDDAMAMSPEMKLSKFASVVVGARISRTGNAMPQAGDLRGESAPTGTRANDLQLVIDSVQP